MKYNHNTSAVPRRLLASLLTLAVLAGVAGCTDDESQLGINLFDPSLIYNGQRDTLYANMAYSTPEDSLLTTNYSYGIIGNYRDNTFGSVSSVLYTQIALPNNATSIDFSNKVIDSVELTLVKNALYPDSSRSYNFHFEVMQLAEAVKSDTQYYSFNSLPVADGEYYFNSTVRVADSDTVIRLLLDRSIAATLNHTASADEFTDITKGLRVRIVDDADMGMISINFAAVGTRLRVHYHMDTSSTPYYYDFLMSSGATHFTQFIHDYAGTVFDGRDTISGTRRLYLEPLGGFVAKVGFEQAVRNFAEAHPHAVIHRAVLLLPVDGNDLGYKPELVVAMARNSAGKLTYIDDLLDAYALAGFNGKYDAASGCYRLSVTQHLQGLLRQGYDDGTLLLLDSRRSSAARMAIAGTATTNPIRIEFVYTE